MDQPKTLFSNTLNTMYKGGMKYNNMKNKDKKLSKKYPF